MIYLINVTQKNNSWFGDFVDRINTTELEIKNTPDTDRSASYLDLHLEIERKFTNFPFICSTIPAAPAYGVYISQLIRYSRACGSYQDRELLLTRKLLNQGFLLVKLKSSIRKFYENQMTSKVLRKPL